MANQPDRNHAIERLLREARPGIAVAPDGPCASAEQLAAWLDQGLPEAESAKLETHLAACAACQALLGAYAATAPATELHSRTWTRAAMPFAAAAVLVIGVWIAGTRWAQQSVPGAAVERQMSRVEEPSAAPVLPAPVAVNPPAPADRADERSADLANLNARANAPAAAREQKLAPAPEAADRTATQEPVRAIASPPAEVREAEAPAASPAPQAVASARESASARAETDRARQEVSADPPAPARADGVSTAAARLGSASAAKAAGTRVAFSSPDGSWRWRIAGAALEVSSDGGTMWLPATGITQVDLEDVATGASPARGVSWLVGRGGLVFVSADGRRFTRAVAPAAAPLTRVQAVDASTANVQAADGRAWRTTDGARSWVQLR